MNCAGTAGYDGTIIERPIIADNFELFSDPLVMMEPS
jgi:hypothetical protein